MTIQSETIVNLNLFDVRMKDRKEVRQINRDTREPKKPQNWDLINMKREFGMETTDQEENIWYSYVRMCGNHDTDLCYDTMDTMKSLGVQGILSWDQTEYSLGEVLSMFSKSQKRDLNTNEYVLRDSHSRLELYPNMCRQNAMEVCLDSGGEYKYVEGVMVPTGWGSPITHSWNIDPHGDHVDFSLHESVTGRDTYHSGVGVYFGIEIPIDIVQRVWDLTKRTPPIIPFLDIIKKDVSSN